MPLPPELTEFTTASQSIASYDYVDIINGIGVEIFYATKATDTGGTTYHLISEAIECDKTTVQQGWLGYPNLADEDFDLTAFATPRTVKGTAQLSAWFYTGGNDSFTIQLKKWDGTSETNISAIKTFTKGSGALSKSVYINLPLTETVFAEGDVLRATITLTAGSALSIDPSGQQKDPIGTIVMNPTRLLIPFKLDL